MQNRISLDSFYIGQSIKDISGQLERSPSVREVLDDNEKLYDFGVATSFKTKTESPEVVAIIGGMKLTTFDAEVEVGNSLSEVIEALGEPTKKVEDFSPGKQGEEVKSQVESGVIRLVYHFEDVATTIFFDGARVRGILLREMSS